MTEQEWLACVKPETMLTALQQAGRLTDRKVRLFDCACVRRIWDMLTDERSRRAIEIAEQYADQQVGLEVLEDAQRGALDVWVRFQRSQPKNSGGHETISSRASAMALSSGGTALALRSAIGACGTTKTDDNPRTHWPRANHDVIGAVSTRRLYSPEGTEAAYNAMYTRHARKSWDIGQYTTDEEAEHCRLLRDIFPAPMVNVIIDPSWLTSTVSALVRGIHADQSFDLLPILADALEDSGCNDDRLLSHCRGPEKHVRGCWVLDALLGRS